jgi:hypothetical protein
VPTMRPWANTHRTLVQWEVRWWSCTACGDERIVALNIAAHRARMIFIGARPLQAALFLQRLSEIVPGPPELLNLTPMLLIGDCMTGGQQV